MPKFAFRVDLRLPRRRRAYLKVRAGLTRTQDPPTTKPRTRAAAPPPAVAAGTALPSAPIAAADLTWIFGYGRGRCGSTWLARMLSDYSNAVLWGGPMIGLMVGHFYYSETIEGRELAWERERVEFILSSDRDGRALPLRQYILEAARMRARFSEIRGPEGVTTMVAQEIHGSRGAPLIMEALPESPMILMVRDPRDAVASQLAAERTGSWIHEAIRKPHGAELGVETDSENEFVTEAVRDNLLGFERAREAYQLHEGPKAIVRYEDLRRDPLAEMSILLAQLGRDVDEERLRAVVDSRSWAKIPDSEKGPDKFYRKAEPGSHRQDLTGKQIQIVEDAFTGVLDEYYAGWSSCAG